MKDIIRVPKNWTEQSIKNAYAMFLHRRRRLLELDRAYFTGEVGSENQTYVSNNCKYICDTKSSYVAGIPPAYSAAEGDVKGRAIIDLYKAQVKPQLDQQLVSDCSRYGLAFEVGFCESEVSEDGRVTLVPKSVEVSPLEAFVAYDESLDPDSVFGAIHYVEVDDNHQATHYLDIYDDRVKQRYRLSGDGDTAAWTKVGPEAIHGFDRVPITEYRNNPDMIGDFQSILPLQRALNEILSDRVKDKNRFASAIMVGQGVTLGDTDEEVDESIGHIKDQEYVSIPGDASLQYLVKTFDESSVQVLVDYIKGEMHKISGIPDMTDEQFAANSSGVAIQYKLLSLNNLAQSLVAQFQRGFLRRCKLYSYVLFGEDGADVESMAITFRFNAPADSSYDVQTMQTYVQNGAMSTRTMIENNPFVDDVEEELRRIEDENDRADERQRRQETDVLQQTLVDAVNAEDEDAVEE